MTQNPSGGAAGSRSRRVSTEDAVVEVAGSGSDPAAQAERRPPWRGLLGPHAPISRHIGPVAWPLSNGDRLEVAPFDESAHAVPLGNGSRRAMDLHSIADAQVSVVDLRETLAGTGNRRFVGLRRLPRMWQRILVLLIPPLVVAGVGAIWLLGGPSSGTDVAVATAPSVSSTVLAPLPPLTTAGVDATIAPTSTEPPTTTTTTTSTTTPSTSVPAAAPFIEPADAPLDVSAMRLHWRGIGNLRFGDDFGEVLGSLAATLGQPDRDTGVVVSRGEYGTCRNDEIRAVEWGPLAVVALAGADGVVAFHGYEVDGRLRDILGVPLELTTLSGLRVGDTVATVEEIYTTSSYQVVLGDDTPQGPKFEVLAGDTVMLWGLLSSVEEDGTVQGILSPTACDG